MKYDKFTGAEIKEGDNPSHIGKMCLNCKYLLEENDGYRCTNEAVMQKGKDKVIAALPEGYEIENLVLKPLALRNPRNKCGNYEADLQTLLAIIEKELA